MSGAQGQFLTIAGRWQRHAKLLAHLPEKDRTLAMLMFYAGFSAGMDACVEAADYNEYTACRLLDALRQEEAEAAARMIMASEMLGAGQGPVQ